MTKLASGPRRDNKKINTFSLLIATTSHASFDKGMLSAESPSQCLYGPLAYGRIRPTQFISVLNFLEVTPYICLLNTAQAVCGWKHTTQWWHTFRQPYEDFRIGRRRCIVVCTTAYSTPQATIISVSSRAVSTLKRDES
jgi:hypothetical protein